MTNQLSKLTKKQHEKFLTILDFKDLRTLAFAAGGERGKAWDEPNYDEVCDNLAEKYQDQISGIISRS